MKMFLVHATRMFYLPWRVLWRFGWLVVLVTSDLFYKMTKCWCHHDKAFVWTLLCQTARVLWGDLENSPRFGKDLLTPFCRDVWVHIASVSLLKYNVEKNFAWIFSDIFLPRFWNPVILQGEEWFLRRE